VLASNTVQAHGESGVGISMTIYRGSVKRMSGHILVSKKNLYSRFNFIKDYEYWRIPNHFIEVGPQPTPYRFASHREKIYYVNGRKQVYETDIVNPANVLFNPVGYQMLENLCWYPIQFKLLEKVEWVFL